MTLSFRQLNLIGFLGCVGALAFALYLQHFQGLEPCNMCIFQRVAFLSAGLFFLAGLIHGPRTGGRWAYAGLVAFAAVIGAGLAARHVWIQHLPEDEVPACGGTLDFLFDVMPWQEVVKNVLRGDTDCAKINAAFLGLSLPFWTMLVFIGMTIYALAMPAIAKISDRKTA